MNIVKYKNIFFVISLVIIIPGILSLLFWGLKPSIDFAGGSQLTLLFPKTVTATTVSQIKTVFSQQKQQLVTIQSANKQVVLRTVPLDQKQNTQLITALQKNVGKFTEEEFATIGPVIGSETTLNAIYSVIAASILIVIYIAWSFREVPKPESSWRFGICAIIALLHDALVVLGIFSLLGHFFGVEIDSLFVTAILTVIGFSVHDTIVVFDRIRENLRRTRMPFATIVNESMLQTMTRSLNTSLTVLLVLSALLLFGGESTRWFIAALLIGVISGTYSSIFNASLLLVVWHDWSEKRKK
jgi:preprotein translocase subunit SecF